MKGVARARPAFGPSVAAQNRRATVATSRAVAPFYMIPLACGGEVTIDSQGYRPNVAVVLFNDEGRVLTCKRVQRKDRKNSESWQFPQGGIEINEDVVDAAKRELYEETYIPSSDVELVAEYPAWLRYELDDRKKSVFGNSRYKGQTQKYLLMRFLGDESVIDLTVPGYKQEHEAYEWKPLEETPYLVSEAKRDVYKQVARAFAPKVLAELRRCPHS